jgi:hypothetical protein
MNLTIFFKEKNEFNFIYFNFNSLQILGLTSINIFNET